MNDLVAHIAAFTNMFGAKNADVIFPFANIKWENKDDRNRFLSELVVLNDNKRIGE